ncbi:MAG: peroxiredoxin family protein [Pirellulaceae bacterium]|nr:peroxiredoxin family protein [Pirellulaceae bacterium]
MAREVPARIKLRERRLAPTANGKTPNCEKSLHHWGESAILTHLGCLHSLVRMKGSDMRPLQQLSVFSVLILVISTGLLGADDRKLESGDQALPFKSTDLEGKPFSFEPDKSGRWTVLVFLRGYPGYQCPLCSKQVGELLAVAEDLSKARADVVFVYPGVNKELTAKAKEFLADRQLPTGFSMAIDQDYAVINAYRVRWQAPRETAYPATFVIDPTGVIRYAKISQTHGDRAPVKDVLSALGKP